MNYIQEIFDRYTAFWRASEKYNPPSRATVRPLHEAFQLIQKHKLKNLSQEELKLAISAQTMKLMQQVRHGTAKGRFVLEEREERIAIEEFARFLVDDYFYGHCRGDGAFISGKKLEMIEHSCEWMYRGLPQ